MSNGLTFELYNIFLQNFQDTKKLAFILDQLSPPDRI